MVTWARVNIGSGNGLLPEYTESFLSNIDITIGVEWESPEAILQEIQQPSCSKMTLKINLKFDLNLLRASGLKATSLCHYEL